jgi:dihydrofolate reductase
MKPKHDLQLKPKYTAFVATSIDGRIAKSSRGSGAKLDWTSREDWDFFQASLARMDAVIVGRNTYNIAKKYIERRHAIVLTTRTSESKTLGMTTFLHPKKTDVKKHIEKKRYKRVAVLGGAGVYDYCLRHKMLDEFFVTVEPYVFTTGVQMFSGQKFSKYKFSLVSMKRLNKRGSILLKYKKIKG